MRSHAAFVLTTVLATLWLGGAAPAPVAPARAGAADSAATHAVALLTGDAVGRADLTAAIPADFRAVMGYEPQLVADPDGTVHLVDPEGGCSWLGDTTFGFGRACRSHDLGYDLLRYAEAQGAELEPWARRAIDDRLGADLRARCAEVDGAAACRSLARVVVAGVAVNSWRQGYGAPVAERPWPFVFAAVLVAAAVCRGRGEPHARRAGAIAGAVCSHSLWVRSGPRT